MLKTFSQKSIPEKWKPKFILRRINGEDIEVSLNSASQIKDAVASGSRFIEVKGSMVMVNTIRSIDPKWGEKNIPPCPDPIKKFELKDEKNALMIITNQQEIDEWKSLFDLTDIEGTENEN